MIGDRERVDRVDLAECCGRNAASAKYSGPTEFWLQDSEGQKGMLGSESKGYPTGRGLCEWVDTRGVVEWVHRSATRNEFNEAVTEEAKAKCSGSARLRGFGEIGAVPDVGPAISTEIAKYSRNCRKGPVSDIQRRLEGTSPLMSGNTLQEPKRQYKNKETIQGAGNRDWGNIRMGNRCSAGDCHTCLAFSRVMISAYVTLNRGYGRQLGRYAEI